SAPDYCGLRVAEVLRREQALHDHVVDTVRGHGEERAAHEAGQQPARTREAAIQVNDAELGGGRANIDDPGEAAGNELHEHHERSNTAEQIQEHLYDVDPDDRLQPAMVRVDHGEHARDDDRLR